MKDDRLYLGHIRDAIVRIQRYTQDGRDVFFSQEETQDAVVRNLEIIGEATKKMSESTKSRAPEVPWREIAGMRDKVIHDYAGVRLDLVWEVVERNLPPLLHATERLLSGAER